MFKWSWGKAFWGLDPIDTWIWIWIYVSKFDTGFFPLNIAVEFVLAMWPLRKDLLNATVSIFLLAFPGVCCLCLREVCVTGTKGVSTEA